MHWLTKATLFTLSGLVLISCENEKTISEPEKPDNTVLVDSIIQLSLNWNESTLVDMDHLGEKIKSPFTYHSSDEEFNFNGISISSEKRSDLKGILKLDRNETYNCSEFKDYKVCLKQLKDGSQLRLSIKPHPTRKWVFTLERIN